MNASTEPATARELRQIAAGVLDTITTHMRTADALERNARAPATIEKRVHSTPDSVIDAIAQRCAMETQSAWTTLGDALEPHLWRLVFEIGNATITIRGTLDPYPIDTLDVTARTNTGLCDQHRPAGKHASACTWLAARMAR